MNYQAFAEWMTSLSLSGRIAALALIYSSLTVGTRQLFLPEVKGKELVVLDMLLGINEIHHTLSNQLVAYATADKEAFSIEGFGRVLAEITQKYRIEGFLEAAVEFARSRISPDG